MPSPRYTVRLPPALDARVQARVRAGTPFAVLIREALSAYLADSLPTPADTTDNLLEMQQQLAELTTRVKVIEEILTHWPQLADSPADSSADRTPTPADSPADRAPTPAAPPAAPRHPGRPSGPMRQQILAALQAHPGGLRAEELRVHIQARRPIGDTLQGMLKAGVIVAQGRGPQRRYVAGAIPP
jgi:type IV secretory pathway VirB10-like protein